MTGEHLKLLQRYAGKVLTLFDSDERRQEGDEPGHGAVFGWGGPRFRHRIAGGEDPDSFLKKEGAPGRLPSEWPRRARFSTGFSGSWSKRSNIGTIDGKVRVVEELAPHVKKITDPVERDLYLKEIARILGINERVFGEKSRGRQPLLLRNFLRGGKERKAVPARKTCSWPLPGNIPKWPGRWLNTGSANLFPVEFVPVAEAIIAQARQGQNRSTGALILDQVGSPEERSRLAALFVNDVHLEGINALKMFDDQCSTSREKQSLSVMVTEERVGRRSIPKAAAIGRCWRTSNTLGNRKSQLA